MRKTIYHIVLPDEFKRQTAENRYQPDSLASEGFIHCTAEEATTLLVLNDYFSATPENSPLLLLAIDTSRLRSEVRFEAPAPLPGAGTSHLQQPTLFPHIYGALNTDAIAGIGEIRRIAGTFAWPERFVDAEEYFAHDEG